MGKHIILTAKIPCDDPATDLTASQRAAMIKYVNADDAHADYLAALELDRMMQLENLGRIEYDSREFVVLEPPHAVLQVETRGYLLRHSPYEIGPSLDVGPQERAKIVAALGAKGDWYVTRYDKKNTYRRVDGFEPA